MLIRHLILLLFAIFLAVGCTKPPLADNGDVTSSIASRIDQQAVWYQGCPDEHIKGFVTSLIENVLTPEAAIQIAFLKNPDVQATFEELGIAHADLIEAGLLSNPDFSLESRYPHNKNHVTNIEYLITAAFLDIFLIPLRTKVAAAEFEQVKRRVAQEIIQLAFEVRQTYYALIGEQQKHAYTKSVADVTRIRAEIASEQGVIGNVNLLDVQQNQARYLEANVKIAQEQFTIIRLREKLNRLLGLREDAGLIFPELPQELEDCDFDLAALETLALETRMDLQEARFAVIRLQRMLGLKEWWAYTNLRVGLAGEREPEGLNVVGFGITGDIPIFNFGQAARRRLHAQLRQAQDRYEALEVRILSEVRVAHELLMSALGMLYQYRVEILPLQKKVLNTSSELYNVMGLGVDQLLENKRQELEAQRSYVDMLKEYWMARVQLDRALGGNVL